MDEGLKSPHWPGGASGVVEIVLGAALVLAWRYRVRGLGGFNGDGD